MRRPLVWSIVVGLAVVGSQVAHGLAYRLAATDAAPYAAGVRADGTRVRGVPAADPRDHHRRRPGDPRVVAEVRLATIGLVLGRAVSLGLRRRAARDLRVQEHFERLAPAGAFPCSPPPSRRSSSGCSLQAPLALVLLYAAARFYSCCVVRTLGRLLA